MNVKISYTVPFDEVPSRVQGLLNENRNKLEEAAVVINQVDVSNKNIMHDLQAIDNVRKLLLRVDTQLADCYSILYGYNKVVIESMEQPQEVEDAVNMDSDSQEG